MTEERTRRITETFDPVTSTGNADQYDKGQILGEIDRLRGGGIGTSAPELLTSLGKSWYDASSKLDDVRSKLQSVGERLAAVWQSESSTASQRVLMRIHDAADDLSRTSDGMYRYTDQVGATMQQHLSSFPGGDGGPGLFESGGRIVGGVQLGPVGSAVGGTVGGWVDDGVGAIGGALGLGGDPNEEYREALAALNAQLVSDNTMMPGSVSVELPQIESGIEGGRGGWDYPGGGLPGGGLLGSGLPGGGGHIPGGGPPRGSPDLPDRPGGLPPGDTPPAGDYGPLPDGIPSGPGGGQDAPGGGLAGGPGGPSIGGPGIGGPGGIGAGGPGVGGGGLPGIGTGGLGGSTGGVPGGAVARPGGMGMMPMGAGAGGRAAGGRGTSVGGALGRGAGAGLGRTGAAGGMMPMGAGGGKGTTGGRPGAGAGGALRSGGGRAAGGMMPIGAGGRGSEDSHTSHDSWLVEDDDPWGGDEIDVPPGVIK